MNNSPKIVNCCTYTVVQLLVGSDHIRRKIPTACPEEIYKFLLYRALYFHHLNKKTENPLCRTAEVSFFEPVEGVSQLVLVMGLWQSLR